MQSSGSDMFVVFPISFSGPPPPPHLGRPPARPPPPRGPTRHLAAVDQFLRPFHDDLLTRRKTFQDLDGAAAADADPDRLESSPAFVNGIHLEAIEVGHQRCLRDHIDSARRATGCPPGRTCPA